MQFYCESLTQYKRLKTREVKIGDLLLGNPAGHQAHPIRVQTMTTTDTMDTIATVEQSIRCIEAGSELIRITAPSKREAENLLNIKNELRRRGYSTPIVADIHFTPNAAEIAARIVEKVRVNPGNYIDKKKFEIIEYSDAGYHEEIDRIRERFTPLIKICKEYGTAMRIGTNHGSLSDRIMSRYGDTPMGMVESAMEFLRIARDENYHQIVLSMKSSNPQVMVQAYRLLVKTMFEEFGECYPLHLGVTEAGDGEDGRIKSAIGIGTLLEDGLGDTIRVSLTEDPEHEIPVCKNILKRYENHESLQQGGMDRESIPFIEKISYDPFSYKRRETFTVENIGGHNVPVVVAHFSKMEKIVPNGLKNIGYSYDADLDKWNIGDGAADYIFTADQEINFALPGTLKVLVDHDAWININDKEKYFPVLNAHEYVDDTKLRSSQINFVLVDRYSAGYSQPLLPGLFEKLKNDHTAVICLSSTNKNATQSIRRMFVELENNKIENPVVVICDSSDNDMNKSLIHYSIETGALFLEGMGDGIWLGMKNEANAENRENVSGRNYNNNLTIEQFINNTAFSILQATRTRISKTEYISCPSCGRTLFDLQETTAKIRAVTNHLKGVKIAIMGCIVNGPGEMADADFGYVGSGPGRITLYKGKEIVKRNVKSEIAVEELINLLKENGAWVEPKELSLL
jgi:(E)-4-hydroxy-3-methylbut-2-enyl-diphosphate synthase